MSIGFGTAPSVRVELFEAARQGLSRSDITTLAQSRHRVVRETIAARADVPLGVLAALANDECHQVRAAVASNPHAARSLIDHLSRDHHHAVALGLVRNDAVPREVLAVLAGHRKADVREIALGRLDSAPLGEVAADPDARFPELRDRAILTTVGAPAPVYAPVQAYTPAHDTSSLSLLARRIAQGAPVGHASRPRAVAHADRGVVAAS